MALTVGELNGIITIDDRAVNPALRRAENALRDSGSRMGDDAERTGQQVGQQLGQGLIRGADGQWRTMRGELADAVTAAAAEAEAQAHRAGQRIGDGVTSGLNGLRGDAGRIGQQAGDDLGEGLADGAADGADEAVHQAESGLSKLKTAALGVGAAAGAVLIDAFGQAMEQGQITAKLGAQLGKTPAQAKRFGEIAGNLYADAITEDFQQAADTIGGVMGSGLVPADATNKQIESISRKVADLSNAFGQDLVGVTNAATQLIRTGLAKNSTEALDLIAAGFGTSANKADDFLDTLNEYSVQFKRVGLDGKTSIGLINQAITAGARDSDQVADAIGQFGELAIGQSKGVQDAFKSIGLDSDTIAAKLKKGGKSGQEALQMTTDALRNTKDETTRLNAATALFGDPGTVMGDALFALDPAGAAAQSGMDKASGAAGKLGDGLRDNAAAEVTRFKNTMQQELVEFLGNKVIPKLEGFFKFAQNNAPLLIGLAGAVTALGAAFSIAAIGVWAMNSAMLANPIFWIVAGAVAVVAGAVLLIVTYWDEIKSATTTAWQWIVDKVKWAIGGIADAVGRIAAIPGQVAAWWQMVVTRTAQIATAWVAWVRGLPGKVSGAIAAMSGYLKARAEQAWTAFRNAAVAKIVAFIGYVKGVPGRVTGAIGAVKSLLYSKGTEIVSGLWNGISAMGGWIRSKLISWAKSVIPGPIAKALGIASPSKVTTAQGRWIARGLVAGLTGSTKQVKAASQKLADIVRDSLAPGRKRANALGKISAGTKQLLTLARREEQLATRMKAATKKLADQRKARDKLAADVKKGVLDSANITQQDTGGWPQTAETILAGLKQNRAAAEAFAANLAKLRKKGVRADLIAQIAQAGVEQGSSAAAALANADSGQIKAINKEQHLLAVAAGKAGDSAGNAMYQSGIRAAQGLVKGLRSKQKAIEQQMLQIAKGMSKAIRKALGIKSPSKVMAQVGAYTAQGLVKGMEGEKSAVNRSMSSLVETPTPGSMGWPGASSRAGGNAQRVVFELRSSGRAEDDYLMGRMRRGIRKVGGPDATFALTGRRSG